MEDSFIIILNKTFPIKSFLINVYIMVKFTIKNQMEKEVLDGIMVNIIQGNGQMLRNMALVNGQEHKKIIILVNGSMDNKMDQVNINGMEMFILVNGRIQSKMVMELNNFKMVINTLEIIIVVNHRDKVNIDGQMVPSIKDNSQKE